MDLLHVARDDLRHKVPNNGVTIIEALRDQSCKIRYRTSYGFGHGF